MPPSRRRVLLAKPRGYCAGVEGAVRTVEVCLEKHGAPIYLRKQIVHKRPCREDPSKNRGAVFVDGPHGVTVSVRDPERAAWLSQTTQSVDETLATVAALRRRVPEPAGSAVR